jgi:CBS domain-containing protein
VECRGFSSRVLVLVLDVMRQGNGLPLVQSGMPTPEALEQTYAKRIGTKVAVAPDMRPVGIVTDGDVRWLIVRFLDVDTTPNPRSITAHALALEYASAMDTQTEPPPGRQRRRQVDERVDRDQTLLRRCFPPESTRP